MTDLFAALGDTSDYVTTQQNTTGELTPVLTISPDSGVGLVLRNRVETGTQAGLPIYAKLLDSGSNPLPNNTKVAIGYERPADDSFTVVSDPFRTIQSYRNKTLTEQQNQDNVDAVKHVLDGPELQVRDVDNAYLLVESSAQVDHSNAEFYIESKGVEERDIE